MPDTHTQDNRTARIATPLGKDVLLLARFDVTEAMGENYIIHADVLSEQQYMNFNNIMGQICSIHIDTIDGVGRDFSGVMTEGRWVGMQDNLAAYSITLRPWLWLLSLTSDCRIFQNKTPPDIIKEVFKDRGFTNQVVDLITHDYPTLEYCVQYRETDLNFVTRLMEEYGIYYYFQFDNGDGVSPSTHYLVLGDTSSHLPVPGLASISFSPSTVGQDRHEEQRLVRWMKDQSMVTGVFTLNDYYYEKPGASMLATADYQYPYQHGNMEIYDYPGDYIERDKGEALAEVLRDIERPRSERCSGSGYCPSLTPGYTINRLSTIDADPDVGNYLVLKCTHFFGTQAYTSQHDGGHAAIGYYADYEFAKSDLPYRMPQRARRPIISGTQSALVVGQQGEEIDVDKEGRVCVQFYWDRKKTASRRVRVAQFWAGSHRGAKFLPRIGDEVLIQYDEGDPDRPLVIGSVYNGTNPIPSDLPPKKNVSGILTKSTKNSDGYHMLTFDDTAGHEVIKLRSQRDLMVKALRNETREIQGSQAESIGGNLTQTVAGDQKITVGVTAPPSGGNYSVTTTKTISLTAQETITLTVGASTITMTKADITLKSPMIYLNP